MPVHKKDTLEALAKNTSLRRRVGKKGFGNKDCLHL